MLLKFRIIVLLFFPITLLAQSIEEKIDKLCHANVNSFTPLSGTVLVAHHGEVIYKKAFGYADIKKKIKNEIDSKYFIGSITKQFTTVAILQLVEKNKLSLSDPLSKWLPMIKESNKITIHHLLAHQSGLRRDAVQGYDVNASPEERALSIKDSMLLFQPGEKEAYSSVGFYALTYILEQVSGLAYQDYFAKNIFEPTGMDNTGVRMNLTQCIPNLSVGIHKNPDAYGVDILDYARYFDSYSLGGGGSLYSTVDDMFLFFMAIQNGKLLSDGMVKQMATKWPIQTERKSKLYYSYGWEIWDFSNEEMKRLIMGYGGRIYGYKSMIRYYPNDDLLIIVFCNSEFSERSILGSNIRYAVFDRPYDIPAQRPEKIAYNEKMKTYEGVYDYTSEKTQVVIKFINGKLTLASHGDKPLYLYPSSENAFFSDMIPLKVKFEKSPDQKIQYLEWNYNDEMIEKIKRVD